MVGTAGDDALFDLCDTVTLEDQPAKLAELVLRSVCKLWRQSASRCGRILTLEFVTRSTIRIAEFDRWQLKREFILTSIVRHRGPPPLSTPSSLSSFRKCFAPNFTLRCSAHTFGECLRPPVQKSNGRLHFRQQGGWYVNGALVNGARTLMVRSLIFTTE
jgi:hypothetical protein